MKPDEERLAEALMIERLHGERANDVVFERVKALAETEDWEGVNRWMEVAEWLDRLRKPHGPVH